MAFPHRNQFGFALFYWHVSVVFLPLPQHIYELTHGARDTVTNFGKDLLKLKQTAKISLELASGIVTDIMDQVMDYLNQLNLCYP